jgi:hypothetical protein
VLILVHAALHLQQCHPGEFEVNLCDIGRQRIGHCVKKLTEIHYSRLINTVKAPSADTQSGIVRSYRSQIHHGHYPHLKPKVMKSTMRLQGWQRVSCVLAEMGVFPS